MSKRAEYPCAALLSCLIANIMTSNFIIIVLIFYVPHSLSTIQVPLSISPSNLFTPAGAKIMTNEFRNN